MMSAYYVRQMAETWAATCTSPYYSTMNMEQDPSDEIWFTLEFDTYGYQKESFCDNWVETGSITLVFFGVAGVGWETLVQRAEQDTAIFRANKDASMKLVITGMDSPDEISAGDVPFYALSVTLDYEYRP